MCQSTLADVGCDPAPTKRSTSYGFVHLIVNLQAGACKGMRTYVCIHLRAYSQLRKRREALKQPRRQRRQLIAVQMPAQAQAASDWRGGCLTRAPRATRAHPSHPCSSCSVCDAHACPCIRVCGRTVHMHTHAHKLTRPTLLHTNRCAWVT